MRKRSTSGATIRRGRRRPMLLAVLGLGAPLLAAAPSLAQTAPAPSAQTRPAPGPQAPTPQGTTPEVTAQAAAALQAALRAWVVNLLAPALLLPEPPLTVSPDDNRFRLALPLEALTGNAKDEMTARLTPLDGGRWSFDDVRVPDKGQVTIPPTGNDPSTGFSGMWSIGDQSIRGVYDPAFSQRSGAALELRNFEFAGSGAGQKHAQRFDRYAIQGTLIPSADGRLDLVQEGVIADWEASSEEGGIVTNIEIRRARETGRIEGISRERLETMTTAIRGLLAEASNGADPTTLTATTRKHLLAIVDSLRDAVTRVEGEQIIDDFSVEVAGIGAASLDHVRFGMGGEAPGGKLRLWLDMAMEGLDIDGLPDNLKKYLPSRLVLRPAIAGVNTDRFFTLLKDALAENPDAKKLESDAMALMTQDGANIGIEVLTLELDPVRLDGTGKLRMLAADKAGFEGRITAAGFDDLVAAARKDRDLQPALPFLMMARGMARPDGTKLIWDLALTEDQALINGVDIMKMGAPQDPPKDQKKPSNKR